MAKSTNRAGPFLYLKVLDPKGKKLSFRSEREAKRRVVRNGRYIEGDGGKNEDRASKE